MAIRLIIISKNRHRVSFYIIARRLQGIIIVYLDIDVVVILAIVVLLYGEIRCIRVCFTETRIFHFFAFLFFYYWYFTQICCVFLIVDLTIVEFFK